MMSQSQLKTDGPDLPWLSLSDALHTPDCFAPELFLPHEWSQIDRSRRRDILDHVASCPVCEAHRQLAQSFAVTCDQATSSPQSGAGRWRTSHWPTSMAAAILAALGLGLWLNGSAPGVPRLPDAPLSTGITRGSAMVLDGRIEADKPVFEWGAVHGAERYRLRAQDVTDRVVWSAETAALMLVATTNNSAGASTWRWSVEALGADGEIVAASPTLAGDALERLTNQ